MQNQQNQIQQQQPKLGIAALKSVLNNDAIKQKFADMLGKKAQGFITSVINVCSNNAMLANADANSIVLAAANAAALDLPVDPNLGYAAIIPFYDSKKKCNVASLQIQRNGWVELAQRTGKVQNLVNELVYEGELVSKNRFKDEYIFDETKRTSDKVIGAMAYIKTTNGFEKTVFWTADECRAHGLRYSQTYKKGYGLWVTNPEAMMLKGLALDTLIATPDGFTTMGDIQVGDTVYNGLGEITTVIAKSEVKHLPCYEVVFQNGDSFICDEEHRWFVRGGHICSKDKEWTVMDTKELYIAKALGFPVVMPENPTVVGEEKELPIDPYILGYWLGNGSRCAATVCCDEDDADEIAAKFEKFYNVGRRHDDRSRSVVLNISSKTGCRKDGSSLKQMLKVAGVYGNKHIPDIYFRASVNQRLELVKGLMDSDGSICNNRGRCNFTSTRQELRDGLYTLLCSLGERVCKSSNLSRGYGVTTMAYNVHWQPKVNPFNLERKRSRVRPRAVDTTNVLKAVIKVDSVPTQCIAVDSGNAIEENDLRKSFLIGEGHYVTHNTVIKNLIVKYAPKSIELNDAIVKDQASFSGDINNQKVEYLDSPQSEEVGEAVDFEEVDTDSGEVQQEEEPTTIIVVEEDEPTNGVFTISAKSATVVASNTVMTYGAEELGQTATVNGAEGTDAMSYTLSRETGENVGTTNGELFNEKEQQ